MKRKILIVEDNIGLSQMQKDWFGQAGYDAITAMNEPIARSLIRKNNFDLIISDVRLPEGDGISLLKWLKKEKMDIPFIITTEYVSVPDVVRTIKLGARDYLPKPVHREHLLELAEDIFRPIATRWEQKRELLKRTCPKMLEVERCAKIGCPIRYVSTDTRCKWDGKGIRGTEHSRGQRTCRDAFRGCQLRCAAP